MQLSKGKELDVFDRSIDVQISRTQKLIEEDPINQIFFKQNGGSVIFLTQTVPPNN